MPSLAKTDTSPTTTLLQDPLTLQTAVVAANPILPSIYLPTTTQSDLATSTKYLTGGETTSPKTLEFLDLLLLMTTTTCYLHSGSVKVTLSTLLSCGRMPIAILEEEIPLEQTHLQSKPPSKRNSMMPE